MEYLKTKEVADILRVTEKTLMTWRHNKQGPPYIRTATGMIRYPKDGLKKWLEEARGEIAGID